MPKAAGEDGTQDKGNNEMQLFLNTALSHNGKKMRGEH